MDNDIYLQWRTSLSISALYTIFQSTSYYAKLFDDNNFSSNDNNDKSKRELISSCVAHVTESLSTFYILSTSNKNGILRLVNVLEQPQPSHLSSTSSKKDNKNVNNNNNSNNNSVFDKSLEYCVYLENWDNTDIMNTNANATFDAIDRYNTKSALITSSSYYQQYYPKLNIGDAIWTSFQTLFTISKTLSSTITTTTSSLTSKRNAYNNDNRNTLLILKAIFTPSLTLYIHTLRRFPGQKNVVPMALSGFLALANTSLRNGTTSSTDEDIKKQRISERNALISSLCKITTDTLSSSSSSPRSIKELRNYQIESLSCLFYIIHIHFNAISSRSDWNIIVYTLHQLSSLSLLNYYSSKDMYPTSMALSMAMTRLSNFSKCFNNQCLICFLEACMELSFAFFRQNNASTKNSSDNNATALSVNDDDDNHLVSASMSASASTTLGNKFFSLAGRAFGGVSSTMIDNNADEPSTPTSAHYHRSSERKQHHRHHSPSPTPAISKRNFGDDARQSILSNIINITQSSNAITTSTSESIIKDATSFGTRSTGSTKGQQPIVPLSLLLLVDCTLVNIYRFNDFGDIVIPHLCDIAALFVDVRQFVIDIVCHFILTRLSKQTDSNGTTMTMPEELLSDENKEQKNLKRIPRGNPTPEYYFVYEEVYEEIIANHDNPNDINNITANELSQEKLLEPLCKSMSITEDKEYAMCGLNALYVILEGVGRK